MTAFVLLPLLMQPPGADQECSISGRVYSASTGAPLKKAQVRLTGQGVNARLSEAARATDAEGNFRFDHLHAGQYTAMADRSGYLSFGGTHAPCGTTDVTIRMTPQGMIYGRVVDDDDEAAPGANVSIYRRAWVRGQRRLQMVHTTVAQADGSFVLGSLPPGSYFLGAMGNSRVERGEAYVETFFPNTPDAQAATAVTVTAGADIRGLSLRVRTAHVYSIRGTAAGPGGERVSAVPLILMNTGGTNRGGMSNTSRGGGTFEFHNVAPGSYLIQAVSYQLPGSGTPAWTAHFPVTVGEADVEGVHIVLSPGAEIPGVVKVGEELSPLIQNVTLEPQNGEGVSYNAQARNGSFTLRNVPPALYQVQLQFLPGGYYIKGMRFAGRDLARRELDLSAGGNGTLEIQLSAKPGSLGGGVRNSNGDPVPDVTVNVWTNDDPEIRTVRTNASGGFMLRDLAPGEYHAIAWEQLDRGVIESPAFRAAFESRSTAVSLAEGSRENVDLKIVPKTVTDAEVAKLP